MSDHEPLVSLVTPSFNQGRYLEQTLLSVLSQSYPRIEYLVMDGGSTDGSVEILRRHGSRLAYWQSRRDAGFADAIAQGFQRSHGQILAYLNSDDLLAPDAVERAVGFLGQHAEVAMVYGDRVCIDEAGRLLYYKPNLPILARTPFIAMTIAQESCFWRRDIYQRVGGIDPSLRFAIDYDLFSRITQAGRVVHVRGLWGFFRKHPQSKTMTQMRTLGEAEGGAIEEARWGARISPARRRAVRSFMQAYALCVTPWVRKPAWPACLPKLPPESWLRRLRKMWPKPAR
jgi:glycosyltransferase involved in cell wall biosynthesis